MCNPVVAIAMTVVSAAMQVQQGNAARKAANANAENTRRISEHNAQVQEANAENLREAGQDAKSRGANAAARARLDAIRANSKARAINAGSGLAVNSGNNLFMQGQNAQYGQVNADILMNNAEREAYGYELQAVDRLNQANNIRAGGQATANNQSYQGELAKQSSLYDAAGTLVSGGSQFYDSYGNPFADDFSWGGWGDKAGSASTRGRA